MPCWTPPWLTLMSRLRLLSRLHRASQLRAGNDPAGQRRGRRIRKASWSLAALAGPPDRWRPARTLARAAGYRIKQRQLSSLDHPGRDVERL